MYATGKIKTVGDTFEAEYMDFCNNDFPESAPSKNNHVTFLHQHDMICQDSGRSVLILSYFFLTTLSSVGFGDYHPRNDYERLLCTIVFLFGCMIFGYVLGNYGDIIVEYENLTADLDMGDELARFFGLLKHFNDSEDMDWTMQQNIEQYFQYKWLNDRNQAIDDQYEKDIIDELPREVTNKLYQEFLYKDLLVQFQPTFRLAKKQENPSDNIKYYMWETDETYREYMLSTLAFMEPRQEE